MPRKRKLPLQKKESGKNQIKKQHIGDFDNLFTCADPDFCISVAQLLDKIEISRYKSCYVAQIAQSVEQGIENPCVAGSIPALGTI